MKVKVIAIVVILILLLGGGFLLLNKKSSTPSPTSYTSPSPSTQATTSTSLSNLFAMGKSQSCDITYPDNGGGGKMYIGDKKMRGDFKVNETGGKVIETHMIFDGSYMYYWSSSDKNGMKMKFDPNKATPSPTASVQGSVQNKTLDLNSKVDYKCSSWNVDASLLTPPSNITFTDFSSLVAPTSSPSSNSTGTTSQCAACDSLTGTAKTYCLSSLNCK